MSTLNFTRLSLLLSLFSFLFGSLQAQQVDTLAFQDFETSPAAPVWTYAGTPFGFQSGYTTATATPANSPIGIGGSRAWHVEAVSGGNPLTFANTVIPAGYDSVRVRARVAGMNLTATSGGPDNLDYILFEYSTDGGATWTGRIRVRGAINNNCSWPYSAATIAKEYYLPATEAVWQPTNTGLQLQEGVGTVEIVFPGSITQLSMRVTPRSSSTSDDWLVDNLVLEGQKLCQPSTGGFSASACASYTSPSGNHTWTSSGTYMDTIPNQTGCDSVLTINLSINNTSDSLSETVCDSYISPSGLYTWTSTGMYMDTITNSLGCDSILSISLTVNSSTLDSLSESACDSYTSPSGNHTWTSSGTYMDTLSTAMGCDSVLMIALTIETVDTTVSQSGDTLMAMSGLSYQWIDCGSGMPVAGATGQSFLPTQSGSYAVALSGALCADTSACHTITLVSRDAGIAGATLHCWPNPAGDVLHVDWGRPLSGSLQLTDLQGRLLRTQDFEHVPALDLSLESLPAGMYLLRLRSEGGQQVLQVVKE